MWLESGSFVLFPIKLPVPYTQDTACFKMEDRISRTKFKSGLSNQIQIQCIYKAITKIEKQHIVTSEKLYSDKVLHRFTSFYSLLA